MTLPVHPVTTGFDERLKNLASRKIAASLLMQQILYYQIFFDIGWLCFWWWFIFDQYLKGIHLHDNDIVRTVMFIFWFLAEPTRMVAGWYGNLQENVPWMLMYVTLTIIPLQAVTWYLYMGAFRRKAYTNAVQIAQAIMLESGLVVGILTAFRMYKLQKEQYYLFSHILSMRARERAERAAYPNRGS